MEVVTLLPAVASRPRKDMELGAPVSEGSQSGETGNFFVVYLRFLLDKAARAT